VRSSKDASGDDHQVDNLTALGFVENLPLPYQKGADMLTILGPRLRADYALLFPGHQIPATPDPPS
jgi:hypothetical protein